MVANRTILAASSAAVVGVLAGYPTRMQTQPYDSIGACVKQTYREEGFRGFFRGIVPPLITVSIIKSISFSVYESTKSFCKARYPFYDQDTLISTMAISTTGGFTSGSFIAVLSCPFELIKIQRQLEFLLQASSISTGATVVRSIAENELKRSRSTINRTVGAGIPISPTAKPPSNNSSSSYSSSSSVRTVSTSSWCSAKEIVRKRARDALGTGVYFGGYETTKYLLTSPDRPAGPLTQFFAGGVCGILCWLVVFPVDLVKSLMQKEILAPQPMYKNASACVRDIYHQRGMAGFYRGVTVTLMRAFPIHSLNFLVYEQTLLFVRYASHHTHEHVSL
ncbi:hypothetical protein DFQ28_005886 [Apophysomyces sp. BC1034]|nr:hypothetical protein DFQ28_005886 [Apophysomyces sp. BC1034]